MAKLNEIYKCEVCGNVVEVLHSGSGELVCCGKPMVLLKENFEGEYFEKHSPVLEKNDEGVIVRVGNVLHPMEESHYIEWVEILTDNGVGRKYLFPGQEPIVRFRVKSEIKKVRMYCNIHGLWVSEGF